MTLGGLTIPQLDTVVWPAQARLTLTVPSADDYHLLSCFTLQAEKFRCDHQLLARLTHLGEALRMHGVGEGTWRALLDAGAVTSLLDWLSLDHTDLTRVPGIGEAFATQLVERFHAAQEQPFHAWLDALGAPPGSEQVSGDWATLFAYKREQWQTLPGVGPVRADALVAFFSHPQVQRMARKLQQARVASF